jgi:hypothetical protein
VSEPETRRLIIVSVDQENLALPPLGGSGDPTLGGASLELFNPGTGESDTFSLPADHWKALGTPPGSRGYRYRDRGGTCPYARLRAGRLLKAVCKGSGIRFSLDEPFQGSLGVTLALGATGDSRYCILFGGTVHRDVQTADGTTGWFRARKAAPPAACP